MSNRRLKKEDQVMLYEEMIQRISGIDTQEAHNPSFNNERNLEKVDLTKGNKNNDLGTEQKLNEIRINRKRNSSEFEASIISSSDENPQNLSQYNNVSKWAVNSVQWSLQDEKRQAKRQRKEAKIEEEKK